MAPPPRTLKDVVITTVQPSEKTEHPGILQASGFDLRTLDRYAANVFFYPKPRAGESSSAFETVSLLKESLSKALVPYYPFAGRWVRTNDGSRLRELQCSDVGVPFIEASMEEDLASVMINTKDYIPQEQLGGFQFMGLDPTAYKQNVDFPLPALFVQITHFRCGGLALHVSFYHMTADGLGMFTFMKAWSEIASSGKTTIVPIHDRSLTLARDALPPILARLEDSNKKPSNLQTLTTVKHDPMTRKIFHVKRKVIEELKCEAAKRNTTATTVELITAHMCLTFNKLAKSSDGGVTTVLSIFVNGRTKFHDPPLPANFCGNASLPFVIPQVAVDESATFVDSHLAAAASVHSVVQAIGPASWRDALENQTKALPLLLDPGKPERAGPKKTQTVQFVSISSGLWFPMYEIGFGRPELERPDFVCPNDLSRPLNGMVHVLPPPPALAKDTIAIVRVRVPKSDNETLFSDEEFLSFFH